MDHLLVERVTELPSPAIADLVEESAAIGFEFLRRLESEWRSGANRFDRPGECLFFALLCERVVGVCGLNLDPYSNSPTTGRLRHLYVAAACRRAGIGRALVRKTVSEAAKTFAILTLRTNTVNASVFYEALGFMRTQTLPNSTHYLELHGLAARALRGIDGGG